MNETKKSDFSEALRDYRAFILGSDGHVIDRSRYVLCR